MAQSPQLSLSVEVSTQLPEQRLSFADAHEPPPVPADADADADADVPPPVPVIPPVLASKGAPRQPIAGKTSAASTAARHESQMPSFIEVSLAGSSDARRIGPVHFTRSPALIARPTRGIRALSC
jgi:hypothetical protein